MTKKQAAIVTGGLTKTSKMPCMSYSLPIIACRTGFRMRAIAGSVCSTCYAGKNFYAMYAGTIEPAQHARLDATLNADLEEWVSAMVCLIGDDEYFRWLDSGDLQSIEMLERIAEVCRRTPKTRHWLPTREYSIVAAFSAQYDVPLNLVIRLSAMFPDQPVKVPASLAGVSGVVVSNVHKAGSKSLGSRCIAPDQGGKCGDCRNCWNRKIKTVSYQNH
jgi:hypothetical protein